MDMQAVRIAKEANVQDTIHTHTHAHAVDRVSSYTLLFELFGDAWLTDRAVRRLFTNSKENHFQHFDNSVWIVYLPKRVIQNAA